jgi:hypothetical protein
MLSHQFDPATNESSPAASGSRAAILDQLRETIDRAADRPTAPVISSGSIELDRELPAGGFRAGSLVEWLGDAGSGATTLALLAARNAADNINSAPRPIAIVDEQNRFYPPAAAALGIDPAQLLLIAPANRRDAAWATHQVLASPAIAALVAWPAALDDRMLRRFQLAAEKASVLGCFIRPPQVRDSPTWADVRLLVEPLAACSSVDLLHSAPIHGVPSHSVPIPNAPGSARRFRIEVLHCRGGRSGASLELELHDETHTLHLAASLAPATPVSRPARA